MVRYGYGPLGPLLHKVAMLIATFRDLFTIKNDIQEIYNMYVNSLAEAFATVSER